jgi:hypothetical protein
MGLKKAILILLGAILLTSFILNLGCIKEEIQYKQNGNDGVSDRDNESKYSFLTFEYPPVDLDKIAFIIPLGGMIGSHVTPIDHQYYVSYDFEKGNEADVDIDVYSPGDGVVTQIQHMNVAAGDDPIAIDDFRLVIEHSQEISSIFIHIDKLSDKIAAVDPGLGKYAYVNVDVSAGEIIGKYGGSVDYNIVDENVLLPFVNPDSYSGEDWKIHCPDPFDYFNETIKKKMIEKCLRSHIPIGGKICYDVDGRLIGTWFEDGTNGYAGVDKDRYWASHLSIVYDSIDPNAVIVSIGTFVDSARQFAVKNNSPDPANITVNDGLVFYDLVDFEYIKNDTVWNRTSLVKGLKVRESDFVRGVILLQLIEDRKLKVELFPNKSSEEIKGFTDNTVIYIR